MPKWQNFAKSGHIVRISIYPGLFLFIFFLFTSQFKFNLKKAQMLHVGFEPAATIRQAQTDQLNNGNHLFSLFLTVQLTEFFKTNPVFDQFLRDQDLLKVDMVGVAFPESVLASYNADKGDMLYSNTLGSYFIK